MTEKIFIRAEIQGELPNGQKVVHLLANNADGFVFCTDDESIIRPQEVENQSQNFNVLVSDHRCLQQSFENLKELYEAEKRKVEKTKEKRIQLAKELQTAKKEIERLSDRSHKCIYLSDDETTEYCVDGPCPKFKTEEQIKVEAFEEFAKRLKSEYINDKRYDRPNAHTLLVCLFGKIDSILKEKVGEG